MPPIDANVIGWILTIAIVAFGYGKTYQKVSHSAKLLENGLPDDVKNHGERLTRLETIVERQEARGDKMDSKLDTLLERSESVSQPIAKKE